MGTIENLKPTSRTRSGPRYSGSPDELIIAYDFENDDGVIVWSSLVFTEVLVSSFRQHACCHAEDVSGLIVSEVADSELLKKTKLRWQESVGWLENECARGGYSRFKHFKMYFDDAGCLDVIAANWTVGSGTPPDHAAACTSAE